MAKRRSKRKKKQISPPTNAAKPVVSAKGRALRDIARSSRFRFAALFALSCIGLYAFIHVLPASLTKPINNHTASMLGLALKALGTPVLSARDIVSGGGQAFRIVPECTPIFSAGLFLCFLLFYPATFREKATGLLMGIPVLYLGNLARLSTTFMISRYDRRFFEVVHVYLGQVFTIFLVIVVSIVWLKWLDRKESAHSISMKLPIPRFHPSSNLPLGCESYRLESGGNYLPSLSGGGQGWGWGHYRISNEAAGFLARFAFISGCLFLVWLKAHHLYIWFLDRLTLFGFSLFNYQVPLAPHTVYYYETFSIVVFASLILAAWSLPWKTKVKGLAAGLGILFITHLIHRINNVLLAYFNYTAIVPVDLTLLVIGQFLVPMLFLIVLFRLQRIDVRTVST